VVAKVRHWPRAAHARSIGAIHNNVARLVGTDQSECANCFRDAGYASA
jgi:hypothetical protein